MSIQRTENHNSRNYWQLENLKRSLVTDLQLKPLGLIKGTWPWLFYQHALWMAYVSTWRSLMELKWQLTFCVLYCWMSLCYFLGLLSRLGNTEFCFARTYFPCVGWSCCNKMPTTMGFTGPYGVVKKWVWWHQTVGSRIKCLGHQEGGENYSQHQWMQFC